MTREQAIEIVKSQYPHDHVMKTALGLLIPELRESEDERIRKAIQIALSLDSAKGYLRSWGISYEQADAWLEKQKYDRMKPIYDARESFESALEKAWNDYHNGYENVDKLEDDYVECAHAKGFREGYLFGIEKQKEQKHPNGCFTCDEYKKGYEVGRLNGFTAGYNKAKKEQKPVEKQDYSGLNDLERAIHRGFLCVGVENVPVTIIKETAQECLAQMKPAEWSEKDERILERAIHIIVEYSDIDEKESEIIQKWLKSLYLQPKQGFILTEEQEKKFGHLFSRPSWKPSEEQIRSLEYFIKLWGDSNGQLKYTKVFNDVKSLCEQLKKL